MRSLWSANAPSFFRLGHPSPSSRKFPKTPTTKRAGRKGGFRGEFRPALRTCDAFRLFRAIWCFLRNCCGTWNRTKILGFKGPCPTVRRSRKVLKHYHQNPKSTGLKLPTRSSVARRSVAKLSEGDPLDDPAIYPTHSGHETRLQHFYHSHNHLYSCECVPILVNRMHPLYSWNIAR